MKKITLISLSALTVLFTACGEETKKVVEEVNKTKVVQAVKEDTMTALETAQHKITEAAETAKTAASKMAEEAKVEAKKVTAKAAELTQSATEALTSEPPVAYNKCKGCHGIDGKTAALGKSAIIAGQTKEALITSLNAYKAGKKDVVGSGDLMKRQVATMSDEEIEAVAEYLSQI